MMERLASNGAGQKSIVNEATYLNVRRTASSLRTKNRG